MAINNQPGNPIQLLTDVTEQNSPVLTLAHGCAEICVSNQGPGDENIRLQRYYEDGGGWQNLGGNVSRYSDRAETFPGGFYRLRAATAGPRGWIYHTLAADRVFLTETEGTIGAITALAGDTEATLNWLAHNNPKSPLINIQYRYATGANGAFGAWQNVSPTAVTVTVSSLVNGTLYRFQMRAVSIAGDGDISEEVSVTPSAA